MVPKHAFGSAENLAAFRTTLRDKLGPLARSREEEPEMAQIEVTHSGGDRYRVRVEEGGSRTEHEVTAPADERQRYGGSASAEKLLEASFEFLLEREPQQAILRSFRLSVIERYFPEYPEEITRRLG